MIWVIQENIHREDGFQRLLEALEKFEQEYLLVKVIPFVGEISPTPSRKDVICFGSYSMRHHAIKNGWTPGVYDMEHFSYKDLVGVFQKDCLNYSASVSKFSEVSVDIDPLFIRPLHDGKEFVGQVIGKEDFEDWQKRVCNLGLADNGSTLTADTFVVVSTPKIIYSEFRFFVVDGKAVTGSRYKMGSRVVYTECDSNIMETAQTFADRLMNHIDHPYVLDIADTPEGFKILELNTLNCAGFYACDMQKLVGALIEFESNKERLK